MPVSEGSLPTAALKGPKGGYMSQHPPQDPNQDDFAFFKDFFVCVPFLMSLSNLLQDCFCFMGDFFFFSFFDLEARGIFCP